MCGSIVDIQSPSAEITRGNKKEEWRRKKQDENIYGLPYYIGDHKLKLHVIQPTLHQKH